MIDWKLRPLDVRGELGPNEFLLGVVVRGTLQDKFFRSYSIYLFCPKVPLLLTLIIVFSRHSYIWTNVR